MVANAEGRPSVTPAEHAVLEQLRLHAGDQGVATGPNTQTFQRRGKPVHQVEHATCRRLQKAGLVRIDAGGYAHLTEAGTTNTNQQRENTAP